MVKESVKQTLIATDTMMGSQTNVKQIYENLYKTISGSRLDARQTQEAIEKYKNDIRSQFEAFKQEVWNNTLHDDDAVMPEEDPIIPSVPTSEQEIEAKLGKVLRTIQAITISSNLSKTQRRNNSTEFKGTDTPYVGFLLEGLSNRRLQEVISPLPVEQKNAMTQAMLAVCGDLIMRMQSYTAKVATIIATSAAFDKHIIADTERKPLNYVYRGVSFNAEQIRKVYYILLHNRWINDYCSADEFVFFFTGEGAIPTHPIRWMETSVRLALFLDEMVDDNRVWSKTAKVVEVLGQDNRFHPVVRDRIKSVYNSGKVAEICREHKMDIKNMLKDI